MDIHRLSSVTTRLPLQFSVNFIFPGSVLHTGGKKGHFIIGLVTSRIRFLKYGICGRRMFVSPDRLKIVLKSLKLLYITEILKNTHTAQDSRYSQVEHLLMTQQNTHTYFCWLDDLMETTTQHVVFSKVQV